MKIYLSPSNQTDNTGYGGYGTEAYRMNLLADIVQRELAPHATVIRATQSASTSQRATQANQTGIDAYVALHSNGANGQARGTEIWMYPGSARGRELATAINTRVAAIYPGPNRGIKTNADYNETSMPQAPSVILEVAFHDNPQDAAWVIANMDTIGHEIAAGILDYCHHTTGTTPTPVAPAPVAPAPTPNEAPLVVDGIAGRATITLYQKRRGLHVDGIAGPETIRDMQRLTGAPVIDGVYDGQRPALIGEAFPALTTYTGGGTGSPGVRALQRWLGVNPDGIIGHDTIRALQTALNNHRI